MKNWSSADRAAHLARVRERETDVLGPSGRETLDARAKAVLQPANGDRLRLVNEALTALAREGHRVAAPRR
ncbi:hypothetical protein ACHFCA_26475 [Delftia tsuruhatensis]